MSWHNWMLQICTTIPKLNSGDVMRLCMCDGARPPAAVHLDVVLFCSCQNSIGGYRVCGSGLSKLAIGLIQETSMLSGLPSDGLASLGVRSEEHTSELQSRGHLVCRLLLEKKKR